MRNFADSVLAAAREGQGVYLAVEGADGSGKSTVARALVPMIERFTGKKPVEIREPGGTILGEDLRRILQSRSGAYPLDRRTELMLMSAARSQLIAEVVRPALAAGEIVLSDRTALSSFAYQGGEDGLLDREIAAVTQVAVSGIWPDRTAVLVVGAAERRARRNRRTGDVDRFEEGGRVDSAAQRYLTVGPQLPGVVMVPAAGGVDEVAMRVFAAFREVLAPLALETGSVAAELGNSQEAVGVRLGGGDRLKMR